MARLQIAPFDLLLHAVVVNGTIGAFTFTTSLSTVALVRARRPLTPITPGGQRGVEGAWGIID